MTQTLMDTAQTPTDTIETTKNTGKSKPGATTTHTAPEKTAITDPRNMNTRYTTKKTTNERAKEPITNSRNGNTRRTGGKAHAPDD